MDEPSTIHADELVHLIRGCHKAVLILILFLYQVHCWLERVGILKLQGGLLLVRKALF